MPEQYLEATQFMHLTPAGIVVAVVRVISVNVPFSLFFRPLIGQCLLILRGYSSTSCFGVHLTLADSQHCAVACGRNYFEMLLKEHSLCITRQTVCSCVVFPINYKNNNHIAKIYKQNKTAALPVWA